MAYDIYGNNLRSGFCEVHPHVNQEYPCYICDSEYTDQPDPENDLKKLANYYGGWDELRKVINSVEKGTKNDNEDQHHIWIDAFKLIDTNHTIEHLSKLFTINRTI